MGGLSETAWQTAKFYTNTRTALVIELTCRMPSPGKKEARDTPGLRSAPHLSFSYHLGSWPSLGHHHPTEPPFSSMAVTTLPSLSPRTSACSLLCHKLPVSTHPVGLPTPCLFGETASSPQGLAHCFGFYSEQKWIESDFF